MLYERWRNVAAARRNELALRDAASGRRWTFAELFAAGEMQAGANGNLAFPRGNSPEFVLDLLAAWRDRKIACPLETDQLRPDAPPPPAPYVHLKLTSATTGAARLVAFTGEQLAADAENIVTTMGLRAEWPNLGIISIAHSYGFSNLVLPLLLHGVPLILCPSPLPEAVRRAAEQEAALTLPAVPAMWRACHEANAIPPTVRLAISAGAPLAVTLEQEIHSATGLKVHNFYGSSECGGIAYDSSEAPRSDDALAGKTMRNVEVSVAEDGCLIVRSRAVAETYWPEPSANLGAGRFQTSDLCELKGGEIFLRGRASEFINVAGRKVSPFSIERELNQHPAVSACVVFGAPAQGGERGDLIVAAVVTQSPVTNEQLRTFLLERIPAWQVPRDWLFAETLTSNRLGKVSRAEWRSRYQNR
jgi:long-chain acyl-CoA synthetase